MIPDYISETLCCRPCDDYRSAYSPGWQIHDSARVPISQDYLPNWNAGYNKVRQARAELLREKSNVPE